MERLTPTISLLVLMQCALGANAFETPKLAYLEEYTQTGDVRDITGFADRIWIAGGGGIAVHDRTDGRFLFKLTSINGLFGNSVNKLQPNDRGTLTAGGDFGIAEIAASCAHPSKDCLKEVHPFSPKVFDPITDIVRLDEREAFLGHQSGLYRFEKRRGRPLFGGTGMWRAAASGKGGSLVGGMDGRLLHRAPGASAFVPILLLARPILDIAAVDDGFLIADGASLVKLEAGRIKPILDGSRTVTAAVVFSNGPDTVIGASTGGVYEYRDDALFHVADVGARITALYAEEKAIWVGVAFRGLMRLDRKSKALSASLAPQGEICSNHITRLTKFKTFLVAASFDSGGCVLKDGLWKPLEGLTSPFVHGVASDGNYLWVATSAGLSRFDENLVQVPIDENTPKEIQWFQDSAAIALLETKTGFVVGTPWGAVSVSRRGDTYGARFISHFQGAPKHLTALTSYEDGLLISSETEGVRFVGKKRSLNRTYLDPVHLPEAWILDVSAADGGAFWAASCQSGIAYIENDKAVFIGADEGLEDNRTVGVAAYGEGAFAATLGGLSFASREGTARSPVRGPVPDPRGSMVAAFGNTLYLGTESGMAVFKISNEEASSPNR